MFVVISVPVPGGGLLCRNVEVLFLGIRLVARLEREVNANYLSQETSYTYVRTGTELSLLSVSVA